MQNAPQTPNKPQTQGDVFIGTLYELLGYFHLTVSIYGTVPGSQEALDQYLLNAQPIDAGL